MTNSTKIRGMLSFALSGAMLFATLLPVGVHAEGVTPTPTENTYIENQTGDNVSKATTISETQKNNGSEDNDKFKIIYEYGYASKDYWYDIGGFWGSYDKTGSSETEINASDIDFDKYKKDHDNKDLNYSFTHDDIFDIGNYIKNNAPLPKLPDAPPEVPDGWEFTGWRNGGLINYGYDDNKKVIVNTYTAVYKHPETMVFMDAVPDTDGDGICKNNDEIGDWYYYLPVNNVKGETDYTYPDTVLIDGEETHFTYYNEYQDPTTGEWKYDIIAPPTIKIKEGDWIPANYMLQRGVHVSVQIFNRDPKTTEMVDKGSDTDGGIKHNAETLNKDVSKVKEAVEKAKTSGQKETVTIDMKDGANLIPAKVLKEAKGKNVDVVFDMGKYSWTINGNDINTDNLKDINLNVNNDLDDYDDVYDNIKKEVVGNNPYQFFAIAHDGEFGFKATLSLTVPKDMVGKQANLYLCQKNNDGALLIGSSSVSADGKVNFSLSHASDYVIVFSDKKADAISTAANGVTKNVSGTTGNKVTKNVSGITGNKAVAKSPKTGDFSFGQWDVYVILLTASAFCLIYGIYNIYKWKEEK